MPTTFADFIRELETEAHAEGAAATAELEAFREYFQAAVASVDGSVGEGPITTRSENP